MLSDRFHGLLSWSLLLLATLIVIFSLKVPLMKLHGDYDNKLDQRYRMLAQQRITINSANGVSTETGVSELEKADSWLFSTNSIESEVLFELRKVVERVAANNQVVLTQVDSLKAVTVDDVSLAGIKVSGNLTVESAAKFIQSLERHLPLIKLENIELRALRAGRKPGESWIIGLTMDLRAYFLASGKVS